MAAFFVSVDIYKEKYMMIVKNKNHLQRNFGSSLSENFSGDGIHSILSNPTDTLQALNESDLSAKIRNTTQSAKNKLKKFFNGDFTINYNGTFAQIRQGLRKLLSLNLEGRSDYAVYDTPNGKMAFRLTDHNANGNNFIQDDAEINISVYVAFNEYENVDTDVHYKEYKIRPEVFNSKRVECINAIINAVNNALNGNEFEIDSSLAQMQEYNKPMVSDEEEADSEEIKNNVIKTEMKHMNKKLIRLTESDLHKIVKESVNRILKESLDSHMMIDDKNRVFDAFKNLIHVIIWENGNIGGDENTLIDAENGYLQEYGERDLQMIWNNVENYTWNKVDKQNSIGNSMQQPSQP